MTPNELIIELADYYEAHPERWQRGFPRVGNCFCIVNGLQYLAPNRAVADAAITLVGRHLNTIYVGTWNDTRARDVKDVIGVLREVAAP